jgi:protein SCO1/2
MTDAADDRVAKGGTPMAGTLIACALVLFSFVYALNTLTNGFEDWTFEDMRRARAMQGLIAASPLELRTSEGTRQVLWRTQSDGVSAILVDFTYTSCPTVCQTLGAEYLQMQRELADRGIAGRIKLVSLSFDVQRDGVSQLEGYARRHHADPMIWTIAAPLSQGSSQRLLRELDVVVVPDGLGGYVHNGSIHVTDAAGKVLAIFDETEWTEALEFAKRMTASGT